MSRSRRDFKLGTMVVRPLWTLIWLTSTNRNVHGVASWCKESSM